MKLARSSAPACLAAVAVAVLLFLAPPARAQVLQQVPADALVVVKINKLKPVSDKIAAFSAKLGLDQVQPGFKDPLSLMQKQLGVTQGVDPNGEAALVLVNGPMQEQEPPLLVLMPVTDYQAFLKNFPDAKTEDQFSVVTLKDDDKPSYVTKRGNYAAIAPKRQYLEMKAEGLTPAGLAAKEVQTKDIVAYVNMKSARARILPELQKNRQKIIADFEKNFRQQNRAPGANRQRNRGQQQLQQQGEGAQAEEGAGAAGGAAGAGAGAAAQKAKADAAEREKMLPLAKSVINRVLDVAEQVITDTDAATYGWSFGDAGVSATGLVEFTPNSRAAQYVGQLKNSGESMLAGLPQGKYWFFGGTSGNNAEVGAKMINEFVAPIEKEFAALGPQGKAIQDYLAALRTYMGNLKGQSFGWVAPQGMIGQEAVFQMVSVQRGNAPQLLEAGRQMFNSQQSLMQAFGGPAQQQVKTTYTANAKQVDGVSLNLMQTTFALPQGQRATPQQMQAQQMMTWLYGPGGVNAYMGAVGNDRIVAASGASDALLQQLVAAAKEDKDVLGTQAPVQATSAQLPKERLAAWFVSIDEIATSVANYAKAFGMPINFQVPQNLAPLGGTISSEGSAVRVDGYAPTQTLQSVIAAVMQTYMQMQGGQQPGGPGGL